MLCSPSLGGQGISLQRKESRYCLSHCWWAVAPLYSCPPWLSGTRTPVVHKNVSVSVPHQETRSIFHQSYMLSHERAAVSNPKMATVQLLLMCFSNHIYALCFTRWFCMFSTCLFLCYRPYILRSDYIWILLHAFGCTAILDKHLDFEVNHATFLHGVGYF